MANPAETVALPPKGHALTSEEMPIGTNECVLERATEVVKYGGQDRLARCLANMPDKRSAALVAIESLGQRTSYLERALDTGLPLEACSRADNEAPWAYEKMFEHPARRRHSRFSRRGARKISLHCDLTSKPKGDIRWDRHGHGYRLRKRGEFLPQLRAG